MAELAPLVDYCVTIDNDGREPRLVTSEGASSGSGSGGVQQQQQSGWTVFSGVWRDCHLPTKGSGAPPPSR